MFGLQKLNSTHGTVIGLAIAVAGYFWTCSELTTALAYRNYAVSFALILPVGYAIIAFGSCIALGASIRRIDAGLICGALLGAFMLSAM
jgi:hypothetical protein